MEKNIQVGWCSSYIWNWSFPFPLASFCRGSFWEGGSGGIICIRISFSTFLLQKGKHMKSCWKPYYTSHLRLQAAPSSSPKSHRSIVSHRWNHRRRFRRSIHRQNRPSRHVHLRGIEGKWRRKKKTQSFSTVAHPEVVGRRSPFLLGFGNFSGANC